MMRSWGYRDCCWTTALTTLAAEPVVAASANEVGGKLQSTIQAHDPGAQVGAPERSPVSGLFHTSIDGVSGYVSADGRYFIVGDMLDLASRRKVAEEERNEKRRELLRKVRPAKRLSSGRRKRGAHARYAGRRGGGKGSGGETV
jgi:hypothetical protein